MTSMLDMLCPVIISLPLPPKESKATTRNLAIICSLFAIELISSVLAFWTFLKKYIKYRDMARTLGLELLSAGGPKRFSYAKLNAATNDFSNIVGHGGFDIVYKGVLPDHQVVAVKRIKVVGGGETEFWAEVTIIVRMHHLNLVRMCGFCVEKSQRMLVRSSLDSEDWYFPKWAFEKMYKEKNVEDILDRRILDSYDRRVHFEIVAHYEMMDRMVKTAMWCLQDRAEKRSSMGKVAKMLEGTVDMDVPGMPTIFYLGDNDA
ncbi:hypothetical protein GIB67_003378 [Kingdonia uniflora]|uniref:non-specific serine/threonine protein kinase n=1 Tax=Kingdonia uniflora TaxID=39325 RepID=A0A7J7P972_9MAGN|nr:hypothetical protein GIB67_003378 [Kingdonia uniflora]